MNTIEDSLDRLSAMVAEAQGRGISNAAIRADLLRIIDSHQRRLNAYRALAASLDTGTSPNAC